MLYKKKKIRNNNYKKLSHLSYRLRIYDLKDSRHGRRVKMQNVVRYNMNFEELAVSAYVNSMI